MRAQGRLPSSQPESWGPGRALVSQSWDQRSVCAERWASRTASLGRPVPETQKGADGGRCAKIPCERLKMASRDPWKQHPSWLVPGKMPVVYGVCGAGFPTSAGSSTGAGGLHGASLDGNFLANPASCTQRSPRGGRQRGTAPPSPYSEVQTHTSVSFGSPCTFLLPSQFPDPIPGEGAGHRPADQRPAASFRG